jgi:hypothetical protein
MRRVLVLAVLFACGKDTHHSGPPDAPMLMGDLYSLQWGPVTVPANTENTQCVVLQLGNTSAIKVHQIHNTLAPGSHHMILYKDNMDTVEQKTPIDCRPFTGALNLSGMVQPLMITQKSDDMLFLPSGVAHTLAANQMIRIELHYINTTDQPIQLQANADFYAADPATIHDEADILFIGSPDVQLPPNQTTTLEEFFAPSRANLDLSAAKFFAITGHEHHLGTDVTVQVSTGLMATNAKMVYQPNPFLWSEPVTQTWTPEFTVPAGSGFDFTCTWNNTTSAQVQFGESANNEMCFFWAYYYPSKGSHVCVHTTMVGGVDICCPDAGPTLCNMLNK